MSYVLAFSATPVKGGTIEKGLKMVLDAAGAERNELVRLAMKDVRVCLACKKCATTNRCVIKDDVNPLLDKIEHADAFLMSGYPSFGSLNAMMKVFIERNWPLRHNYILTRGKTGAAVVAGGSCLDELDSFFRHYYEGYLGMSFQGTLKLRGNVPCMTCGYGEDCEGSGFLREHGPGAKVTPDKFYDPDRDPDAMRRARELGEAVAKSVAGIGERAV
ncbi:MAG: flavodoxin family protein [Deltaproteobacteria bacterium]|jgi:multimeric flavodoxin WrbA|nr:flavodoxin family protein [Deltaproteobacteria bacterium]